MALSNNQTAVLAGGCFWCMEAVFSDLRGVTAVKSGYAGGQTQQPSYEEVCSGRTGHAEVVRVTYDPAQLDYADLLRVFFTIHDPTTRNRQGADVGTQYRSAIFANSPAQRDIAEAVKAEIDSAGLYAGKIVTDIDELDTFWPAEDKHDDYFARNPWQGYCQAVVAPKVAKFRKTFADRVKVKAA